MTVAQTGIFRDPSSLGDVSKMVVYLPQSLQNENVVNPAHQLETFLNSCSNVKVVFPRNITYTLERQIVLHGVSNLDIDFNGCLLQIPNGVNWPTRYDVNPYSIGTIAFGVYNNSNVIIRNLKIDGAKANAGTVGCFGISVQDTNGLTAHNVTVSNMNYHGIWVTTNTQNIKFYNTNFINNGGISTGGSSDFYTDNDTGSDFAFYHTYCTRTDSITSNQAQIFYINGYNGIVKDVVGHSANIGVDCRKGTHYIEDLYMDTCSHPLMVQSYSNSTEHASIFAKNIRGTNVFADSTGTAFLYIVACQRLEIENIHLEAASSATYNWYGIRVRKLTADPITNVTIKNVVLKGMTQQAIRCENLTDDNIYFENVQAYSGGAGVFLQAGGGNTVNIFMKNYRAFGFTSSIFYDQSPPVISGQNPVLQSGATASRPVNATPQTNPFFDTTLGKPVWCKTAGTNEVDTLTVSAGPTASGNITIALNGVNTTVAVTSGQTAGQVGDDIRATNFPGWYVTGSAGSATVTFTSMNAGTNTAPTFTDTGTTGTAASFSVTHAGTAPAWVDATGASV